MVNNKQYTIQRGPGSRCAPDVPRIPWVHRRPSAGSSSLEPLRISNRVFQNGVSVWGFSLNPQGYGAPNPTQGA